jgi:hypothetical protein
VVPSHFEKYDGTTTHIRTKIYATLVGLAVVLPSHFEKYDGAATPTKIRLSVSRRRISLSP